MIQRYSTKYWSKFSRWFLFPPFCSCWVYRLTSGATDKVTDWFSQQGWKPAKDRPWGCCCFDAVEPQITTYQHYTFKMDILSERIFGDVSKEKSVYWYFIQQSDRFCLLAWDQPSPQPHLWPRKEVQFITSHILEGLSIPATEDISQSPCIHSQTSRVKAIIRQSEAQADEAYMHSNCYSKKSRPRNVPLVV